MPITLALEAKEQANDGPVGAIYYFGKYDGAEFHHPAHLTIEAAIPESKFEELLKLARMGRFPSTVDLRVDGLEFGSVPDGRDLKWDANDKSKMERSVTYIGFSFPLGGDSIKEAAEESGRQLEQPVTAALIEALSARLKSIGSLMAWILGVLVAILALLLFR
jgi:hypothetical protein